MTRTEPDTEELLRRAAGGDLSARGALWQRHRPRLRRMVALRLDPRLAARVDPSDVVQETLAQADRRLDDYLRERPLPFYPWLRQLAGDRLADAHRRHVRAARRSVTREQGVLPPLADASALELAEGLLFQVAAATAGPSEAARRHELRDRVRAALAALPERDREVLVLRHLEQLTAREVAAVLGLTEAGVKSRALRAMQRLRALLGGERAGGER
jgi:RNA polymerase sigma-70 factor (ECF subfamily)